MVKKLSPRRAPFPLMLLVLPVLATSCSDRPAELITITINGHELLVEVARTQEEKEQGLMFREDLAEDRGMLFYYDHDRRMSFWMKNTYIPLSIAFIAADGTINEIRDMEPESLRTVVSNRSVRYALEVNKGAFERAGIGPGDRVRFPEGFR